MSTSLDVSNIDIHALLRAMWHQAPVATFFTINGIPSPSAPTDAEIDDALTLNHRYIDYLNGRPIKTDFTDLKAIKPSYDWDAGSYNSNAVGTLAAIVAALQR